MNNTETSNVNISSERVIPTPKQLKMAFPLTSAAENTVVKARASLQEILKGTDPRIMIIVGPCSIHNSDLALEYAHRLSELDKKVNHSLLIVMRTYFEKPRTSVGWKGFINDPFLNDSFQIEEGLSAARKLLLQISELGVPVGTEALDPVVPQYLDDLISWTAIGARTTESQTHREMASGLSTPVGFKNGTNGSIDVAINALKSVSAGHHFLGINQEGLCTVMKTKGNQFAHLVLRGGDNGPNYDSVHVAQSEHLLKKAGIAPRLMIDCSHGNSMKDHTLQSAVLHDCVHQIIDGNCSIIGAMLESHLHEGNQSIPKDLTLLKHGISVTDACIGWEETEKILCELSEKIHPALKNRKLLTK
jgi:3-deoxy-7-phosphoheptulonate synthase